jgi:hypothetical protein
MNIRLQVPVFVQKIERYKIISPYKTFYSFTLFHYRHNWRYQTSNGSMFHQFRSFLTTHKLAYQLPARKFFYCELFLMLRFLNFTHLLMCFKVFYSSYKSIQNVSFKNNLFKGWDFGRNLLLLYVHLRINYLLAYGGEERFI